MDNKTAINVLEKYTLEGVGLGRIVIDAHNIAIQSIKRLESLLQGKTWILCSERMPPVETEVLIAAKRKYIGGDVKYITTTAMYEDGTVLENDSCWRWEEIEGEWDEENDCYIIPEGWWENRHYNPDEVYNNIVDDEVVAWLPMPAKFDEKDNLSKLTLNESEIISDEVLENAILTQEEFLVRYRKKYEDEPVFDIVILEAMKELKERRKYDCEPKGNDKISEQSPC